MFTSFRLADRAEAGRLLGERLMAYAGEAPVVAGLPRGGVPVAAEVARALGAQLDVLVVRKLPCPGRPELGLGAVGEGGVVVVNREVVAEVRVREAQLRRIVADQVAEVERRSAAYRGVRPRIPVEGRTVVVVDDGLATGFTARAAVEVLRAEGAARVVLAVPVAPASELPGAAAVADEVVCLSAPARFWSVGEWYDDFDQVPDAEVLRLLCATS